MPAMKAGCFTTSEICSARLTFSSDSLPPPVTVGRSAGNSEKERENEKRAKIDQSVTQTECLNRTQLIGKN